VFAGVLTRYGRRAGPARPWFGMVLEEMFGHLVVVRVPEDGPAALAGVQAGDVLVAVSGQGVGTLEEAYRRMWAPGPAGTEVGFTLLQGSELQQVRIRSASRSDYFRVKPGT
jgi:S1-C subfamily serine protease